MVSIVKAGHYAGSTQLRDGRFAEIYEIFNERLMGRIEPMSRYIRLIGLIRLEASSPLSSEALIKIGHVYKRDIYTTSEMESEQERIDGPKIALHEISESLNSITFKLDRKIVALISNIFQKITFIDQTTKAVVAILEVPPICSTPEEEVGIIICDTSKQTVEYFLSSGQPITEQQLIDTAIKYYETHLKKS